MTGNPAEKKYLHVVPDTVQLEHKFYLGSTKDFRGRPDYFESRGLNYEEVIAPDRSDDKLLKIMSRSDLSSVSGIIFEYPIYPRTLKHIRKTNPEIRLLVRAHHAEFFHRIHFFLAAARYTYGWFGVRRHKKMASDIWLRLRQDWACGRLADGVLSITNWEIDRYWKYLAGRKKSHYVPYYLPRAYSDEIGAPQQKKDQCICMLSTGSKIGDFLMDAALNLSRLVQGMDQRHKNWKFAMTGVIPEGKLDLPARIRPTGFLDSPYGILAESKAVALLSDYGYGFKTKFLEAVMSRCYVLVTKGMYKRLPSEIRQFCFVVDVNSQVSFENALVRCQEPFPDVDVNGQLQAIAFSALDDALGIESKIVSNNFI